MAARREVWLTGFYVQDGAGNESLLDPPPPRNFDLQAQHDGECRFRTEGGACDGYVYRVVCKEPGEVGWPIEREPSLQGPAPHRLIPRIRVTVLLN